MTTQINKELLKIEIQYDIKILFAVESGSRAWGFASLDSDWDVRFVYVHKLEWYLKIDNLTDNIEIILPNEIDLSGWELKKALKLYRKCNPSLLEWIKSPIVYIDNYSLKHQLNQMTNVFFNVKAYIYHYLHMAEKNYFDFLVKEKVKTKKYFYVLRPILVCDWMLKFNTIAPVEFAVLIDNINLNKPIKDEIILLLDKKINGIELDLEDRNEVLNDYLKEKIAFFKQYLQNTTAFTNNHTMLLDNLFVKTLNQAWK